MYTCESFFINTDSNLCWNIIQKYGVVDTDGVSLLTIESVGAFKEPFCDLKSSIFFWHLSSCQANKSY